MEGSAAGLPVCPETAMIHVRRLSAALTEGSSVDVWPLVTARRILRNVQGGAYSHRVCGGMVE